MSFSLLCVEDVSNDTLISEYQTCEDVFADEDILDSVELSSENDDTYSDNYPSTESELVHAIDASRMMIFFVDDSVGILIRVMVS